MPGERSVFFKKLDAQVCEVCVLRTPRSDAPRVATTSVGSRRSIMDDIPAGAAARRDYNEEGRKLIASFGMTPAANAYNDKDPLYKDPSTGGIIYVGNETAARGPVDKLLSAGITHVVNCTDDMKNFCEVPATSAPHPKADEPRIQYLRFNVAYWQDAGEGNRPQPASQTQIVAFMRTLFAFVDGALAKGESVLVHCLAGAHRAGTTGCLLLMYKHKLGAQDAIKAAKSLRPIINPIGGLPGFLLFYQRNREEAVQM